MKQVCSLLVIVYVLLFACMPLAQGKEGCSAKIKCKCTCVYTMQWTETDFHASVNGKHQYGLVGKCIANSLCEAMNVCRRKKGDCIRYCESVKPPDSAKWGHQDFSDIMLYPTGSFYSTSCDGQAYLCKAPSFNCTIDSSGEFPPERRF